MTTTQATVTSVTQTVAQTVARAAQTEAQTETQTETQVPHGTASQGRPASASPSRGARHGREGRGARQGRGEREGRGGRGRRTDSGGDLGAGLELLDRATASLLAACHAQTTTDRYVHAYLGALRAGAALLVARRTRRAGLGRHPGQGAGAGSNGPGDGRVVQVWESLRAAAPEFGEWADYLEQVGLRRAEIEAGAVPPSTREADDLLRGAETFLGLIRAALGLPMERIEPALAVAVVGAPGTRSLSRPG